MITVIGSLKGGSGKSTISFNLAVWLAMAEVQVQLIDLDPQQTLTDVVEVRTEEGFEPVLQVVHKEALRRTRLAEADETVIDVGTADMEALQRALQYCDRVLVPVPPSQADIWSTQRFIRLVQNLREKPPQILGFINRGDTHHAIRETNEAAAALVSLPGIKFIRPRIGARTLFRRSFSEGLAVFELDPRSKGSQEFFSLAAALYPTLVS